MAKPFFVSHHSKSSVKLYDKNHRKFVFIEEAVINVSRRPKETLNATRRQKCANRPRSKYIRSLRLEATGRRDTANPQHLETLRHYSQHALYVFRFRCISE
ncbi:hypothetical protein YC2023_045254 [Brassica napus]